MEAIRNQKSEERNNYNYSRDRRIRHSLSFIYRYRTGMYGTGSYVALGDKRFRLASLDWRDDVPSV
jgi:hypothetical protein